MQNIDIHIGKRLRLRRTTVGLSQSALAKSIGITFQQVQKYESGANALNANRLCQFAAFLHVPVAYFFEGFGQLLPHTAGDIAEAHEKIFDHTKCVSDRESLEMMKGFKRVKEHTVRKRIADLVRAIADYSAVG